MLQTLNLQTLNNTAEDIDDFKKFLDLEQHQSITFCQNSMNISLIYVVLPR